MKHTEAEKLFLDKMAVLNKTFLYFIQCSLKEMPDGDLSPCVRDYLKHVEELDRTYGNIPNGDGVSTSTDTDKRDEVINELPKASASEKDGGDGMMLKSNIAHEKPLSSAITAFSSTATPGNVSKPSFDISTTSSSGSEKRGRKRAKKGGPEGGDEEVIISNHNSPVPRYLTSSEKCHINTVSSQTSQSSPVSQCVNTSTAENIFKKGLDSKDDSKTETESEGLQKKGMDDVKETGSNKIPLFLLGRKGDLKKNELLKNPPTLVFTKSFPEEKEPVEKLDEKKEQSEESAGKSHVTPAFSFLKPVMPEGNCGFSHPSKAKLDFKFGAPLAVRSEPDNESEESEYVPPKPEAVLAEEPKAIFSSKCSVFVLKGTEYEKLGIGQLHIKTDESDSVKKILLVRAATTTGTVWVNSYIDESMKYVTIEDVKLRISCVSGGSPATYLLRLPKKEDCDQVVAELQGDSSSS
uniref:RanBD1 domain-containing protein n=1 Tax=Elaeophora elaphi TaxID=1147741 RepID=A0A0R3RH75_9BILA